ncbi:hypothetical protein BDP27DRAFT_1416309 [Rhodocollybia butyracea]|uniref:Uncharacterized protein n=1 Tax=Rhodocollybia butyracea TaxID=206335 RepID=A0A9P5Q6D3_9AGAR|nr:hypothetical protein BDP27DRAFT_1416309 [Rhodocollybia butyracea]
MRKHNIKATSRIFTRFSSQAALPEGLNSKISPKPPTSINPLILPASRTAPFTSIPRSLIPSVIGVLSGTEAGGVPPFAAVYPPSRHNDNSSSHEPAPSSAQDLWTRAFTLAAKDVKTIPGKILVFSIERSQASYRPWVPPTVSRTGVDPLPVPVLHQPIRLTLSHYTTLIYGLTLRRDYSLALIWVRKLIYPFPSSASPLSSPSRASKDPRQAIHVSLDGHALSAALVVLAKRGRVHEAVSVLEAYAAPTILSSSDTRHARHVKMNTIQMNDFLVSLLRWPSKQHALAVPSAQFPLKPPSGQTKGGSFAALFRPYQSTHATRSARPDLILRLLPALYPRYGVSWDSRTVCVMLQAVRMAVKMDAISAFGLRRVMKKMFGGGGSSQDQKMDIEAIPYGKAGSGAQEAGEVKQQWLIARINEILWQPIESDNSTPASQSRNTKKTKKMRKTKPDKKVHRHPQSPFRPLEYSPFTPWPWLHPSSSQLSSSTSTALVHDDKQSSLTTHPFLLAREVFLRLVWAHAESLNKSTAPKSGYINLHTSHPPATLSPRSFARLLDPDGDGLGHLGGLPKWFETLEGALKRKLGLAVFGSGSKEADNELGGRPRTRIEAVDKMLGYPRITSLTLPKLTAAAFHQYILLLGLGAPEPWEFIQSGWSQRYPFENYPNHTESSTVLNVDSTTTSSDQANYVGSFPQTQTSAQLAFPNPFLIPGLTEIPYALSFMRALRLIPTQDTLCAAVVFWKEAVGGETLFELGLNDYNARREDLSETTARTGDGDAYAGEYEAWKASLKKEQSKDRDGVMDVGGFSTGREMGEYTRFCRWIRDWVDEVNATTRTTMNGETKLTMSMPHPFHIHRWMGVVRTMREGKYDEDETRAKFDEEGRRIAKGERE